MSRFQFTTVLACCLIASNAQAGETDNEDLISFLSDDYVVVGRDLGVQSAYTGTAKIEYKDGHLLMRQVVAGKKYSFIGDIKLVHEVQRIIFTSAGNSGRQMSCLVHGDPENYPRLTCVWESFGAKRESSGVEALFHHEEQSPES